MDHVEPCSTLRIGRVFAVRDPADDEDANADNLDPGVT